MPARTTSIILAGAGALGRRHLEALCRLPGEIHVQVVDPSEDALRQAAIVASASALKLTAHRSAAALDAPADIAIVASNSRERRAIVEALVDLGVGRFLLEKVLFPRLADYEDMTELFSRAGSQVWVNCARRTFPHAKMLREIFAGKPFSYRVEGGDWGLACNLVHHLDEVAYLAGRNDFTLCAGGLDKDVMPAKRAGYYEVTGTIRASLPGGIEMTATSKRGQPADCTVRISSGTVSAAIDQSKETVTLTQNGETTSLPYPIPLQSVITAEHVTRILNGDAPDLPDYETSSEIHKTMISTLLSHFRIALKRPDIDACPIT